MTYNNPKQGMKRPSGLMMALWLMAAMIIIPQISYANPLNQLGQGVGQVKNIAGQAGGAANIANQVTGGNDAASAIGNAAGAIGNVAGGAGDIIGSGQNIIGNVQNVGNIAQNIAGGNVPVGSIVNNVIGNDLQNLAGNAIAGGLNGLFGFGGGGGNPTAGPGGALADTCTDQPIYDMMLGNRLDAILQDIVTLIADSLDGVAERLYYGIILSPNYRNAIWAALILFVTFFGVAFLFGIVPLTFAQGLIRLIKIGVIFMIMSPFGWFYFSDIVVRFFEGGTNYLINLFVAIGSGSVGFINTPIGQFGVGGNGVTFIGSDPAAPFALLEGTMRKVFSPKFFVMVIASLGTGPFGPIMALALAWSILQLFKMILIALEVYLLAMVVRTLLYGLAPIFFAFVLFDRTKNIFMGYINQLVSFSLQPILLFAFLSFFAVLIESAVDDLLNTTEDLCFNKVDKMIGSPYDWQNWRFKVEGEVYEGEWTWEGCVSGNCKVFPIDIVRVLIFLIIAHIGAKMASIISEVAAEISQGVIKLADVSSINQYFGGAGGSSRGISATQMNARTAGG